MLCEVVTAVGEQEREEADIRLVKRGIQGDFPEALPWPPKGNPKGASKGGFWRSI